MVFSVSVDSVASFADSTGLKLKVSLILEIFSGSFLIEEKFMALEL